MNSVSDKNDKYSIIFSVHGTVGRTTGSDLESRVGDQDIRSPGSPVSSRLQVPGELGHCARSNRLGDFPYKFFLTKCPSLAPAEIITLRVDSLAHWKIINQQDAFLAPKNRSQNFSSGNLNSRILGVSG
jgi:hypothetical protein